MPNEFNIISKTDQEKLGNLNYGTIITEAPNNPDSVYIKVDKRKLGSGLSLDFPKSACVLCNLKTGALRAVDGGSRVTVLQATVELTKLTKAELVAEFVKSQCRNY